jgi:uncharacterized repeat protein (TIGR01451 family)
MVSAALLAFVAMAPSLTAAATTGKGGAPAVFVSGTKTVSGFPFPGGSVTYTIVLTNSGSSPQQDNPGHELVDVLPVPLTLVSAMASSGGVTTVPATRTVTWDGSIPAGGSVTILIDATVHRDAPPDTPIPNQGMIAYDANGDGTNEASALTDDPTVAGSADPTVIIFFLDFGPGIPTLGTTGLAFLALLLAIGGVKILNRL